MENKGRHLLGLANAELSSPVDIQGIWGFAKQSDNVTLMPKIPQYI